MNNVDPLDWRAQLLTRVAQRRPMFEHGALMPWNFRPDSIYGKRSLIETAIGRSKSIIGRRNRMLACAQALRRSPAHV